MMWLDLFAGHGVGVALRDMGWGDVAVEKWDVAQEVRALNGLSAPIYEDAWDIHLSAGVHYVDGIWASPPCQSFSAVRAGAAQKNNDVARVLSLLDSGVWQNMDYLKKDAEFLGDERSGLVLTPLTYTLYHGPRYVVLEQVVPVLPIWEGIARQLETLGYSTWTGVLDAADYGVPQNRRRAYLIARNDGTPATPPSKAPAQVTMYEAVGWGFTERCSPTLTGHLTVTRSPTGTQNIFRNAIETGKFVFRPGNDGKPSKTATNGIGSEYPPDAINYTLEDALVLQSYPRDFELYGSKADKQLSIGNAVPPLLAKRIFQHLTRKE